MRKFEPVFTKTFTYQGRVPMNGLVDAALSGYAELYGRIERTLYAESVAKGVKPETLKNGYLPRFGITGRQFNAIRVGLEGKVDSIKERRSGLIEEAQQRLNRAQSVVKKLEAGRANEAVQSSAKRLNKLHQKKRRMATIAARLEVMKADHVAGRARIAFGSRRLFRAQFSLAANGYANHDEWLSDWRSARASQFMVLGSKDENGGCQGCTAQIGDDGLISLRLRLPDAITQGGRKYVHLSGIEVPYGLEAIRQAMAGCDRVEIMEDGSRKPVHEGKALTYRFVRDAKGWRVLISVCVDSPKITSTRRAGAVGVDFNADHLAVAEINRHGNLVGHQRIDLNMRGMNTDQRRAAVGDAVKQVVQCAVARSKPIVLERLDFKDKKSRLEGADSYLARMLSAMAYREFDLMLRAAAFRAGVEVIAVNPAYTSVIGAVNLAARSGISVHLAAACAIARRGLGLSERVLASHTSTKKGCQHGIALVPARNGGHVTLALPERNRTRHVWKQWALVRARLSASHTDFFRSGQARKAPAPLHQVIAAACATRKTQVRSLGASQQNCSADEPEFSNIPW